MTADEIIAALDLAPHPEGGWYRETWAAPAEPGARPTGTAIHFLLQAGERSHWHRVDADEIWFWHAGAPLHLHRARHAQGPADTAILGPDVPAMRTQIVIPAGHWQAAETAGAFTLVSCVVCPGFRFEGFELAPPGFDIPKGR